MAPVTNMRYGDKKFAYFETIHTLVELANPIKEKYLTKTKHQLHNPAVGLDVGLQHLGQWNTLRGSMVN